MIKMPKKWLLSVVNQVKTTCVPFEDLDIYVFKPFLVSSRALQHDEDWQGKSVYLSIFVKHLFNCKAS